MKHSAVVVTRGAPPRTWPLSTEGRRRALALADLLRAFDARRIVSSTEAKAVETADLVARRLGLPATQDAGLGEHAREHAPFLDAEGDFREAVRECFRTPAERVFGEESLGEALDRFAAAVGRVRDPGRDTVVVAHGTVIAAYAASVSGTDGFALWERLGLPSYVVLDAAGAVAEVVPEVRENGVGG